MGALPLIGPRVGRAISRSRSNPDENLMIVFDPAFVRDSGNANGLRVNRCKRGARAFRFRRTLRNKTPIPRAAVLPPGSYGLLALALGKAGRWER